MEKTDHLRRPRVGLIVIDDGIYTHRWAVPFMNDERVETAFVACLSPYSAPNMNPNGAHNICSVCMERVRYYGVPAAITFAVKSLVSKCKDLRFSMGAAVTPHSVTAAARRQKLPLLRAPRGNINDQEFCHEIKSYEPDLLLCSFSQRAEESFIAVPTVGCLNVHFSMLPLHAGREPAFYAMLTGYGAGVSIHWMVHDIDQGDVVVQACVDQSGVTTLDKAILRCCRLAARLAPMAVIRAMSGMGPPRIVTRAQALNNWPTRVMVARFRQKGFSFV